MPLPHPRSIAFLLVATAAAQPQWTVLSPGASPPPRNSAALVYDEMRGLAVLYGGFLSGSGELADTWEWNGSAWSERSPAHDPPPLNGHAMAYDNVRGVTVLFGGARNGWNVGNTTWEYDGTDWAQRATGGPPRRANHEMCFDRARRVVVLFGGQAGRQVGDSLGDTWEWDGRAWAARAVVGPARRTWHAMAYDAARQRCVLFGGLLADNTVAHDTWEWDGRAWSRRTPPTSPPGRIAHEMTYDPVRRRVILFSGYEAGTDTWEFDGTDWTLRATTTSPGSRYGYGFTYDRRLHRALLFGGYQDGQRGDTWTYGAPEPARYAVAGLGCPGQGGTPAITAAAGSLPYLGETFAVQATHLSPSGPTLGVLGLSDTAWGRFALPLELGFLGMPGCRLYPSPDAIVLLDNASGTASWNLPIPNLEILVGGRFHQQVIDASPASNLPGFITSDYGTATIGVR